MRTYQPSGAGLCARPDCGRDVGRHDPGHAFKPAPEEVAHELPYCLAWSHGEVCGMPEEDPIHDKGRALRCPGGDA